MLSQVATFHFLWLSNILLYIYTISSFSMSTDRHLGCFHVLGNVSNAAMNIRAPLSFQMSVSDFFGSIPKSGVTGPYGSSI